jgi:hypothetical protein
MTCHWAAMTRALADGRARTLPIDYASSRCWCGKPVGYRVKAQGHHTSCGPKK